MARSPLAGRRKVTFRLRAEKGTEVYVAGTFNDWNPKDKKLRYREGVHEATLMLPKGRHEYKFITDGIWQIDPECPDWTPNGFGSLNSVIIVE